MTRLDLRIATLNISGGEKTFDIFPHETQLSRRKALEMLVSRLDASVLCLQEVSQYIDADGEIHGLMDCIDRAGDYQHAFFGKTVSMETDLQVKNDVMVKGIFCDWWDWSKGNSIHSRMPFGRFSDSKRSGVPRNIPLYRPVSYEGNRDTDPRYALLARLKEPPSPFIATLHLTTLLGERKPQPAPNKIEQSHLMRYQQLKRLLDLIREHILRQDHPLILAGDFNATTDEFGIAHLLEKEHAFMRLVPDQDIPTHAGSDKAIDHIFFYPKERLVDYHCRVEDGDLGKRASDHLPVIADIRIK